MPRICGFIPVRQRILEERSRATIHIPMTRLRTAELMTLSSCFDASSFRLNRDCPSRYSFMMSAAREGSSIVFFAER